MKSPRYWALQRFFLVLKVRSLLSRNEKPEILGIATLILILL